MIEFLKKIWNWIVSIPQDKLLHDYAGALICLFSFAILFRCTVPFWWSLLIAIVVAVLFLIGKEVYDYFKKEGHSVELADILYGLFGVVKVAIALIIALA